MAERACAEIIVQYIRQRLGRELTEQEKARVDEEIAYQGEMTYRREAVRDFVAALDNARERGTSPRLSRRRRNVGEGDD